MIHLQEGKNLWICFQEGSKLIHTKKNCERVPGESNENLSFLEHVETPPQMNTPCRCHCHVFIMNNFFQGKKNSV